MIRCRRDNFDQLCRERGRTPEDVRDCIVIDDGETIVVDESHEAYPRSRLGLGDYVAAGLSAFGITKERVSAVVGGDCGCGQRRAALNEWGAKTLGIGVEKPIDAP